jgi:hypothetical protein
MVGAKKGMVGVGMGEREFWNLSGVSDSHLLRDLNGFVANGGRVDARVVAHLAEVEERRLHLKAAASSLFDYCLRCLGFSESEAFHRITAARLGRRFPVIFELLGARSIHLSALRVLRDHLTQENHRELLAAAAGKSKKEVEALVAALAPRPDVATLLRKLPVRREAREAPREVCEGAVAPAAVACGVGQVQAVACGVGQVRLVASCTQRGFVNLDLIARTGVTSESAASDSAGSGEGLVAGAGSGLGKSAGRTASGTTSAGAGWSVTGRSLTKGRAWEALSSSRYVLRVSVGSDLKDKLERARDLMSHGNPSGDLEAILERALDLLVEKLEQQRFGWSRCRRGVRKPAMGSGGLARVDVGRAQQSGAGEGEERGEMALADLHECPGANLEIRQGTELSGQTDAESHKVRDSPVGARQHISNEVRRAVARRDGRRCTYVDEEGRRCPSQAFLQFHHEQAHALGGPSTFENLRLLCGAHNRLLAEQDFGRAHQAQCIARWESAVTGRKRM